MDDYLINSLFAGSLLKFLFKKQCIPWESPHTSIFDHRKSQFHEEIGVAVVRIWRENKPDINECYKELKKQGIDDKEAFGKCAVSAADMYFSAGYDHGSFLGYCAIVLGVSSIYYEFPPNGVPEIAAEVVALVLFAHQLTGQFDKHDGWEGLRKISELFNKLPSSTKMVEMKWFEEWRK